MRNSTVRLRLCPFVPAPSDHFFFDSTSQESTLSASFSSCTTCHADAMTFHWTISHAATDGSGDVVEDYATSGVGMQTLAYTFTQAATMYTVSTRAVSQGGERVLKLHQDVMCKYVRREIRQLTTADRERYLSAVRVFHTVDATKGRKAYGPKFTNYAESVQKHLQRMTLDGCTPFHGYDTFLTAHEAFVLEFEQALQAVDPKIAAPYWDYTIDSTLYGHSADIGEKSIIFSDDWFGPVDNSATGDVLTSKYFSNLPVPKDASAPEHNGFGYVTDSVNQSPSPYVTRATSVCGLPTKANLAGCTELRSVFKATSLSALRTQIETVYHASLHMALGGVTDCAYSLEKAAADEMMGRSDASKGEGSSSTSTGSSSSSSRTALFEGLGLMANTIWRTLELGELMRCDTNCDSSATSATTTSKLSASCTCSCPSVDAWSDSEKADLAYDQLDHLGLTQMLLSESATSRFFTTDDLEAAAAAAAAAPSSSSSSTTAESSSALSSAPASPPSSSSSSSSSKVRLAGATEAENAHFWKWFVDFACHPGAMASYATPLAANNDPIFWVSHASWGRFWHFVQLAPSFTASGDFHADWADPTVCMSVSY